MACAVRECIRLYCGIKKWKTVMGKQTAFDIGEMKQGYLTPDERLLRDEFVKEYLKDFDPYKAALRMGFQRVFAEDQGQELINDPYVQAQLPKIRPEPKDQFESDRQLVMDTLRRAAQNGPFNTQVQAATMLSRILGIDKFNDSTTASQELAQAFRDFSENLARDSKY